MAFRAAHLNDIDRVPAAGTIWRPLRRELGATAFGVGAWTGDAAGDAIIEPHDETSRGAGSHEELYIVLSGRASFTVGDERVDAPAGSFLLVAVGTRRAAVAAEPQTTVVAVGGPPGAALPPSPYEYWYAAEPAYAAGDYERAFEIASQGLADHPHNGALRYQLACYRALAGHPEEALTHMRVALDNDARTRQWAADDEDLTPCASCPDSPPSDPVGDQL